MWVVKCETCGVVGIYQNLKSQSTAVKHMSYKRHVVHRYPWDEPQSSEAKTYTPNTLEFDPDDPPF